MSIKEKDLTDILYKKAIVDGDILAYLIVFTDEFHLELKWFALLEMREELEELFHNKFFKGNIEKLKDENN